MLFNLEILSLVALGFFTGGYGTLIGAGGGFILVPCLLLIYPDKTPETITVISLSVVFVNALSGTLVHLRSARIDFKLALVFALTSIPGAVLGAFATAAMSRARFNLAFGILLMLVSTFLVLKPDKSRLATATGEIYQRVRIARTIIGGGLSIIVGYISSFFGIGGGFLYVPALIYLFDYPIHAAAATSLLVLTLTSLAGSVTHLATGKFHGGMNQTLALSIGAFVGAQAAARLSRRLGGVWILRALAIALAVVGFRLAVFAS